MSKKKKKKPNLAKSSEIVKEIRRYFEDTARQADANFQDKADGFFMLRSITSDMLKRTILRLEEEESK